MARKNELQMFEKISITKDQLSKVVKVLDSLEDTAKNYVKITKKYSKYL